MKAEVDKLIELLGSENKKKIQNTRYLTTICIMYALLVGIAVIMKAYMIV